MAERQMTKEEVLQETVRVLLNISVPIGLGEQIAKPIEGAAKNIVAVLAMIKAEKQENAVFEATDEGKVKGDGQDERKADAE